MPIRINDWAKANGFTARDVKAKLEELENKKYSHLSYMPEEQMDIVKTALSSSVPAPQQKDKAVKTASDAQKKQESKVPKVQTTAPSTSKPSQQKQQQQQQQKPQQQQQKPQQQQQKPQQQQQKPQQQQQQKPLQQQQQQKPLQQQQQKPQQQQQKPQQQQQKPLQQQQQFYNSHNRDAYDEYEDNSDDMRGGHVANKQDKQHRQNNGSKESFDHDYRGNRDNRNRNDRDNRNRNDQKDKQRHHDFEQSQQHAPQVNQGKTGEICEVHMKTPIVVKALADAIGHRPNEVIQELMMMNVLASINMTIDADVAIKVSGKFGVTLIIDKRDKEMHQAMQGEENKSAPEERVYTNKESDLAERPPIVTFMGHVDHGKTSLQDAIRKTHVTTTESGGITQHIGASVVSINGKYITFVDTPGHEAFSQMRARGANITDVVVLVVAADDGFMPQTIEAMNHAKAAGVPIIVAVNKMDLPEADYDRVLLNMQQHGIGSEDWGGSVASIKVSARTGMGIPDLLERILLEAEMLELRSNPKNPGQAYVLESELEQGFGPTANIVVKNGTVRVGDVVICGQYFGRIRTLLDVHGKRIQSVGPGMPAKVVGLSGVPAAGMKLAVCESLAEAKQLAEERKAADRDESLNDQRSGTSLADIFGAMEDEERNDLKVIIKTDVSGSTEAIKGSLEKLPSDKIKIDILHADVGAITGTDVNLASTSGAIIIGFHVRVNPGVNELAKKLKVEIRLYSIIYELLEDITDAMAGRLEPEKREKDVGTVRIKQIFHLSNGMDICGCIVEKGFAKVGTKARVIRNKEIIFNGEVRSLRHLKDDVKEVRAGMECGIRLDNFADFTEGDIIQLYDIELKKQTL